MLLRSPKEFEHVAQEWAVVYAGAPRKYTAEGSGGTTDESLRQQEQQMKDGQVDNLDKSVSTLCTSH